MQTTHEVNCIIQAGIRYCEDIPMSNNEIALTLFGIVGVFLYLGLWMWIGSKIEDEYNIFCLIPTILGGILLPMIIVAIVLLAN